jgi:hypothetical protein
LIHRARLCFHAASQPASIRRERLLFAAFEAVRNASPCGAKNPVVAFYNTRAEVELFAAVLRRLRAARPAQ